MIAEIKNTTTTQNTYKNLINYCASKADQYFGHNIISENPDGLIKYFDDIVNDIKVGTKASKKHFHSILSFSKEDENVYKEKSKVEKEIFFESITNYYMRGMGYEKQPYIAYIHNDKKHEHIHIISSNVDIETSKIIKGDFNYFRSLKVVSEIENFYSLPKVKKFKENIGFSNECRNIVDEVLRKDVKNIDDFCEKFNEVSKLEQKNIIANKIEQKNKKQYILFLSEEGKIKSSIKASDVKKDINAVIKKKSNEYRVKKFNLKRVLLTSLSTTKNMEELVKNLNKNKIEVDFIKNSRGIYGVNFIVKNTKIKGSEVNYPYNRIKNIIEGKDDEKFVKEKRIEVEKITSEHVKFALCNYMIQGHNELEKFLKKSDIKLKNDSFSYKDETKLKLKFSQDEIKNRIKINKILNNHIYAKKTSLLEELYKNLNENNIEYKIENNTLKIGKGELEKTIDIDKHNKVLFIKNILLENIYKNNTITSIKNVEKILQLKNIDYVIEKDAIKFGVKKEGKTEYVNGASFGFSLNTISRNIKINAQQQNYSYLNNILNNLLRFENVSAYNNVEEEEKRKRRKKRKKKG